MPLYIYEHPTTGETKEVIQSVHDKHEYLEDGISWNRVFTKPNASVSSLIQDPFSSKEFVEKTANKKGTVGDLMNYSREFSEARENKAGVDPTKQQYYKDWQNKRKGKLHPTIRKQKTKERLGKLGVDVSD